MIILKDNKLVNLNNCEITEKTNSVFDGTPIIQFCGGKITAKFEYETEKKRDQDFDDIIHGLKQGSTFISLDT